MSGEKILLVLPVKDVREAKILLDAIGFWSRRINIPSEKNLCLGLETRLRESWQRANEAIEVKEAQERANAVESKPAGRATPGSGV